MLSSFRKILDANNYDYESATDNYPLSIDEAQVNYVRDSVENFLSEKFLVMPEDLIKHIEVKAIYEKDVRITVNIKALDRIGNKWLKEISTKEIKDELEM